MFSLHIVFVTYLFIFIENVILQRVKNIDFTLLFSDSAIQVSYKFEMLIFKMALVIQHYIHVALLFVHTVAVLII